MAGPLVLHFLQSASSVEQLPEAVAEVAIVGRSNVGKSSLVNALANRKQLAKTSKTPGATRLLNVFELAPQGSGRWLVDLPGYGYAKVSHAERDRWRPMIEGYLTGRSTLLAVLVLLDGEVGPTRLDLQTVEWFHHLGIPVRFVATKGDKVGSSRRPARRADLAAKLGVPKSDVRWVSAAKGWGVDELRDDVRHLLHPPPTTATSAGARGRG
jgi:GTP-binding protein